MSNVDALLLERVAMIEKNGPWPWPAEEASKLSALDWDIDQAYRLADELAGRVYVPRFRHFEQSSSEKINELADALREHLNG